MSGLRTLSKVCEEYATEFDVIFNDKESQFFRSCECVISNLNISVCGAVGNMYDSAIPSWSLISSTNRKSNNNILVTSYHVILMIKI